MSTASPIDLNHRALVDAVARVRASLERYVDDGPGADLAPAEHDQQTALGRLSDTFALSPFEADVLVLCAGVELDSRIAPLCARAHGDPGQGEPTFGLALAALPEAHWSALLPAAPLRYWRLVEVGPGRSLTASALRIDERILHYLTGLDYVDERLVPFLQPLHVPRELPPSQHAGACTVADRLERSRALIALCGRNAAGRRIVAAAACGELGRRLDAVRVDALPAEPAELASLARLWTREAALSGAVLLLELDQVEGDEPRLAAAERLLETLDAPVLTSSRDPVRTLRRACLRVDVHAATRQEQNALWRSELGPLTAQLNGQLDAIVAQFDLDHSAISAAVGDALAEDGDNPDPLAGRLWNACRAQARPRLDDLAERIDSTAGWDDLVLPEPQLDALHEIAAHVRQRTKVYEAWGFARQGSRGLGISALFSGSTGTGKTMAADVLAGDLRLDLYRIDLSSVVSKYIGETEKNLRRLFDAAEGTGVILLFDEADALFGKRTDVKDSHDRFANIEISYLLQRMEAYRGLAILTTNMRAALDAAFLRRIRFSVDFPFPEVAERERIWQRVFPSETPLGTLDLARLARLGVTGGTIRNIGLRAAFLAADADTPVMMEHVVRATRGEYTKLEQSLSDAELGSPR